MLEMQTSISQFYNDENFAGYSVWKTKISSIVRNQYPDLKGEMNRILAENGGYIKVSNIYADSIEFKYSRKFDGNKHSVANIFNELFAKLLNSDTNNGEAIAVLSDSVFRTYSFHPYLSANHELSFVRI